MNIPNLTTFTSVAKKLSAEIKEIWMPFGTLFNLPYIDYEKYNIKSGEHCMISSHVCWLDYFIAEKLYATQEEAHLVSNYCDLIIFSPYLQACIKGYPEKKHNNNLKMSIDHSIFHRIYFIKKQDEYGELFGYGSSDPSPAGLQNLIQHIPTLQKMNNYIINATKKLTKIANQNAVILPDYHSNKYDLLEEQFGEKNQDRITSLFKENFQLTDREFECFKLSSKGLTSKHIAKELMISPRTVEVFLENLKSKLQVNNKLALSEKYFQYFE